MKVIVVDVQRRKDGVAADIDHPVRTHDDSIWVDDVNIRVALQLTVDLGDVSSGDAVQRGSVVRLHEAGHLSVGNGEILPIDHNARCLLMNAELIG